MPCEVKKRNSGAPAKSCVCFQELQEKPLLQGTRIRSLCSGAVRFVLEKGTADWIASAMGTTATSSVCGGLPAGG